MNFLTQIINNLTQPVFLFFLVGVALVAVRSGYEYPPQLYRAITLYLLLSIGLHGGLELAKFDLSRMAMIIVAGFAVNLAIGIASFFILRGPGKLNSVDSAAIAGHYGSDSAAAFAAALGVLQSAKVPYESFMSALLAVMEIPGVLVALVMAQKFARPATRMMLSAVPEHGRPVNHPQDNAHANTHSWGAILREAFLSPGILLLLCGIAIGLIEGHDRVEKILPVFELVFPGIICLYMVEMGMTTAGRFGDVFRVGPFLVGFAFLSPVVWGFAGIVLARVLGLTPGSAVLFGVLTGSSSFIAVPAAVRTAMPQANPSLYMTASLGVTFPFVVSFGIPIYMSMSEWFFRVTGYVAP